MKNNKVFDIDDIGGIEIKNVVCYCPESNKLVIQDRFVTR